MGNVSLATAKAHLSELVERVSNGETVCITRRGKPVAHRCHAVAARARPQIHASDAG
jgi:antitoxin (DNA-binding transcriptional repressor) of toxin-antitoxin stability system